jgi:hypothetical protein
MSSPFFHDGQDAGKALSAIEAKIGELIPVLLILPVGDKLTQLIVTIRTILNHKPRLFSDLKN